MDKWNFKTRLIIAVVVSLIIIIVISVVTGFKYFKYTLILGAVMGVVTLFMSDPEFKKKSMAREKHHRDMQDERERARNRAIGGEEGRLQARENHSVHKKNVKNAERVWDNFGR